jgi:hypothetical protein
MLRSDQVGGSFSDENDRGYFFAVDSQPRLSEPMSLIIRSSKE